MKKCMSCGKIADNDEMMFCSECGSTLEAVVEEAAPEASVVEAAPIVEEVAPVVEEPARAFEAPAAQENKANALDKAKEIFEKNPKLKLIAPIAAAGLIVLIILVSVILTASSPKSAAKGYIDATIEEATRKPATYKYMSPDDKDYYDHRNEDYKDKKVKYKIIDKEKLRGSEYRNIQELYEDEGRVGAAYMFDVRISYIEDHEKEEDIETLLVVKIDGKWCVVPW